MSKNTSHTTKAHDESELGRLRLKLEYNVTWDDEKKSLKERTL